MPIATIYSFLTYPKRNRAPESVVSGTAIAPDDGKLTKMLRDIFDTAGRDCNIPVMFTSDDAQGNAMRTDLITLLKKPSLEAATPLAERLELATTGTSGMGLLFICIGPDGSETRVVLSRFPADEGVVAERSSNKLTVEFVEQVFLKRSKAMADYWIVDFLLSDFATTAATGTKRLAQALKAVVTSTPDADVKRETASAVNLASNIPSRALTIAEFCDSLSLSPKSKAAVAAKVSPSRLVNEKFKFDSAEFARHIAYKQVELDNGAVLTAPAEKFDECFKATKKRDAQRSDAQTFSTTGVVIDERLKKTK